MAEAAKKAPAKKAAPKRRPATKGAAPDQGQATRTGASAKVASTAYDATEERPLEPVTNWEFINRVPTRQEVLDLLQTLPDVWGVSTADFIDYVQVLAQRKQVSVPDEQTGSRIEYVNSWVVYMTVAGRLKMLEAAAFRNGWRVDFEPEPNVPVPGYVDLGNETQRIVYREYVAITQVYGRDEHPLLIREGDHMDGRLHEVTLGRKSGTAWVPRSSDRQNAVGSNPYEKVETAARGRALAAWGFGVLPGSGVASVEEVLGSPDNRTGLNQEQAVARQQAAPAGRPKRPDLLQSVHEQIETMRQTRKVDVSVVMDQVGAYLTNRLGIQDVYDAQEHKVEWSKVKDGQLELLRNDLADGIRTIQENAEQPPL